MLSAFWGGKWQEKGPFSPLQLAVRGHYFETVKTLLENGANINEPAGRKNGGTALQLATLKRVGDEDKSDLRLIHLLLEHGADVDGPPAKDSGRTALQIACSKDEIDFELVNLLLEKGANINAEPAPTRGITALQCAVINGNVELVVYLLERGAKVNASGAQVEGRTAIEAAAEHGRLTIAQILLNAHQAVGETVKLGKAIELANKEDHLGVVKLLEDFVESSVPETFTS